MTEEFEIWRARHFDRYLREDGDILNEIEKDNVERGIPLIGPSLGKLLHILARSVNARRILELGTANGYSAIWLAKALPPGGKIITLEYDKKTAEIARQNIARAGLSDIVEIVVDDALAYLEEAEGPFDMIFIDIEKEFYSAALDDCVRLLRTGGLFFADNVAFSSSGDFNDRLHSHPEMETAFVYGNFRSHNPDEDAVSISVKVEPRGR